MVTRIAPLVVLLVIAVVTLPLVGAMAGGVAEHTSEELDADDILLSISLTEDGTGTLSIEHRYRLPDDETEAAFDSLQTDIEENQSAFVDRFTERMEPTVASAGEATGREMTVENVRITAEKRSLPQEYGIVTYEFEWAGFASVDDTEIEAGDALAGFFLDEETSLVISWPHGYSVDTVAPEPDEQRDRTVLWHGPKDFGANEPAVVVTADESAPDDGTVSVEPVWSQPAVLVGGTSIVAIALGSAAVWWRRNQTAGDPDRDRDRETVTGSQDGRTTDTDDDDPSWELLSNEEKVMRLLEENDGRIKQQEVVKRFDWSDANTSQVVRGLREAGRIETFRIGRENVIVLDDETDET